MRKLKTDWDNVLQRIEAIHAELKENLDAGKLLFFYPSKDAPASGELADFYLGQCRKVVREIHSMARSFAQARSAGTDVNEDSFIDFFLSKIRTFDHSGWDHSEYPDEPQLSRLREQGNIFFPDIISGLDRMLFLATTGRESPEKPLPSIRKSREVAKTYEELTAAPTSAAKLLQERTAKFAETSELVDKTIYALLHRDLRAKLGEWERRFGPQRSYDQARAVLDALPKPSGRFEQEVVRAMNNALSKAAEKAGIETGKAAGI